MDSMGYVTHQLSGLPAVHMSDRVLTLSCQVLSRRSRWWASSRLCLQLPRAPSSPSSRSALGIGAADGCAIWLSLGVLHTVDQYACDLGQNCPLEAARPHVPCCAGAAADGPQREAGLSESAALHDAHRQVNWHPCVRHICKPPLGVTCCAPTLSASCSAHSAHQCASFLDTSRGLVSVPHRVML